jgi:hypothetical protein
MAVDRNDIIENACFSTSTKQWRRILRIDGDKITYESGGSSSVNRTNLSRVTVGIDKFIADVDKVVSADWDPEYLHK